jgi:hypothetical protein
MASIRRAAVSTVDEHATRWAPDLSSQYSVRVIGAALASSSVPTDCLHQVAHRADARDWKGRTAQWRGPRKRGGVEGARTCGRGQLLLLVRHSSDVSSISGFREWLLSKVGVALCAGWLVDKMSAPIPMLVPCTAVI